MLSEILLHLKIVEIYMNDFYIGAKVIDPCFLID
jgi:hypothetical protein